MSYSTVATAIDTILKSATGVVSGAVYKYDRLSVDWKEFFASFRDATNSVIHGYTITRARIESEPEASRVNHVTTTWIIRGYYSLGSNGATESTFQEYIDNIRGKFRDDPSVGGTVLTSSPLQVDVIEARMFGATLCHYAEMRLEVEEQETFT